MCSRNVSRKQSAGKKIVRGIATNSIVVLSQCVSQAIGKKIVRRIATNSIVVLSQCALAIGKKIVRGLQRIL